MALALTPSDRTGPNRTLSPPRCTLGGLGLSRKVEPDPMIYGGELEMDEPRSGCYYCSLAGTRSGALLCCQGRRAIGVMRVGNLTQVRLTAFGIMTSQHTVPTVL